MQYKLPRNMPVYTQPTARSKVLCVKSAGSIVDVHPEFIEGLYSKDQKWLRLMERGYIIVKNGDGDRSINLEELGKALSKAVKED